MDKKRLIFIVDDDPFINTLVVNRFKSEGYAVEAYEAGEDCLDALDNNPRLIILDYLFARESRIFSNGMEIFEKIRELKPDIPVIMLSGQDNGEIVLEFARKGINDYIIKDNNLLENLTLAVRDIFKKEG